MVALGAFLVEKRPFKSYLSKIVKIQHPEKPQTRTKWISCLKRASILSEKPARKIGSKSKKNQLFETSLDPN